MSHQNHFYYHLVDLDPLHQHMTEIEISTDDKQELLDLVHHSIYLEVVHYALTHLPEQQHEKFVEHAEKNPHDTGLLVYLNRSIQNFEENMERVISQTVADFVHEIREYKDTTKEWLGGSS